MTATKKVILDLPVKMLERIYEIIADDSLYEDHYDFIIHAVTDLLEWHENIAGDKNSRSKNNR